MVEIPLFCLFMFFNTVVCLLPTLKLITLALPIFYLLMCTDESAAKSLGLNIFSFYLFYQTGQITI